MIKPVGVFVLVEPIEVEAVTKGGIIIPDEVKDKEQHAIQRGTILAVGSAAEYVGEDCIGKTAIFRRYRGTVIKSEGKEFRLLDNTEIQAVEG